LFLDEVGELPSTPRFGLLRVRRPRSADSNGWAAPQSVEIGRPGDLRHQPRIWKAAINASFFRRDLFFIAVNVFPSGAFSAGTPRRHSDAGQVLHRPIATKAGKRFSRIDKKSLNLAGSPTLARNIRELQT